MTLRAVTILHGSTDRIHGRSRRALCPTGCARDQYLSGVTVAKNALIVSISPLPQNDSQWLPYVSCESCSRMLRSSSDRTSGTCTLTSKQCRPRGPFNPFARRAWTPALGSTSDAPCCVPAHEQKVCIVQVNEADAQPNAGSEASLPFVNTLAMIQQQTATRPLTRSTCNVGCGDLNETHREARAGPLRRSGSSREQCRQGWPSGRAAAALSTTPCLPA